MVNCRTRAIREGRGMSVRSTGDVTRNSFNAQLPVDIQVAGEGTWNASN